MYSLDVYRDGWKNEVEINSNIKLCLLICDNTKGLFLS